MKPDEFPPLTQTTYYILASLMDGEKHGYAIAKDVEWRSEGTVRLAIGNVYVTLKRLLEQGLIERASDAAGHVEGRKTYRISGVGEKVFRAETRRLQTMVRANPVLSPGALGA